MKKRLHALFSGTVQGVGFRYTTEQMARRFPVTGFVKNLPNGQVELVAEGEEKLLQEFLADLKDEFYSYIRDVEIRWQEAAEKYRGFQIQF